MPIRFCILEGICFALKISFPNGYIIAINRYDNTDVIDTDTGENEIWFR